MTYKVSIVNSEKTFTVNSDEKILDAALRQGIILAYGCKNGGCGTCKGLVQQGDYTSSDSLLNSSERSQGLALFCCTTAQSDLKIEVKILEGVRDISIKKIPCRIASIEKASEDIIILKLQLPANEQFVFLPGQYIDFLLKNNQRRSYSIASNPLENTIELHIRHLQGGLFTDALFGVSNPILKVRDILRFEGPLGTFFLRESNHDILMLASGTGFAPIKSIINDIKVKNIKRKIKLYWGARRPKDLYDLKQCQEWIDHLPNFEFIPVISDAISDDKWNGRSGLLHKAVMEDIKDMSNYEVYACGAPIMVESAKNDFIAQCNLSEERFFADAFLSKANTKE